MGSSPLARGTLRRVHSNNPAAGLIPARAGNTSHSTMQEALLGAHPRSRGEHKAAEARPVVVAGSSPLARGTRDSVLGGVYKIGLIPARAGNTRNRM